MVNNLRKILSGILLLTLFLNTNYALMYYGVFKINQDFLSEELCEKKTTDCNACCYLNKKIDEENGDAKTSAPNVKLKQKLSEYTVKDFHPLKNINPSLYSFVDFNININEGYSLIPGKPPQFS